MTDKKLVIILIVAVAVLLGLVVVWRLGGTDGANLTVGDNSSTTITSTARPMTEEEKANVRALMLQFSTTSKPLSTAEQAKQAKEIADTMEAFAAPTTSIPSLKEQKAVYDLMKQFK